MKKMLVIVLILCFIALAMGQVTASDEITVSCDATNFTGLNQSIQNNDAIELENNITLSEGEKERLSEN